MVEQSYKDLTRPAEDKNPLTGMSSHLCTCVLNMRYPRQLSRSYETDPYKGETLREGNPHGMGGRATDKDSDSGVGFSLCRHSVSPLGRVEINQKTLCSPHPSLPDSPRSPLPSSPDRRRTPLLPLPVEDRPPPLVLFPIPFHVWGDRYTGGRAGRD